jgi:CRISPR system Cascade subunit CasB
VEPFLKDENSSSTRKAYYLAAGLWALHWREGRGSGTSLGHACAKFQADSKSTSTERRFIAVLDAEPDQLPHRLRQMVALLKDYDLEFDGLLKALLHWTSEGRWIQIQWARDFYRHLETDTPSLKPQEQEKSL